MATSTVNRKRRNSSLGRKGDPRMRRSLEAREADPQLSLVDALLMGGFEFPKLDSEENSKNVHDTEGVTLYQRKNQLLRRIRKTKQRCNAAKASNNVKQSSSTAVSSRKRTSQSVESFDDFLARKRAPNAKTSTSKGIQSSEEGGKSAEKVATKSSSLENMASEETGKLKASRKQGDSTVVTSKNPVKLSSSSVVSQPKQSPQSKEALPHKDEGRESESSPFGEIKIDVTAFEEMVYPEDEVREHDMLSDRERAEIVKDLYGTTGNPNPGFIPASEALNAFDEALNGIQVSEKKALLQAQNRCPNLVGMKEKETFLRWADFDVKQAAARFVAYWNMRQYLFGEDAFFPLTFDRVGERDKATFQAGIWSILPQRDDHGRAIIWDDPSRRNPEIHKADSEARCLWYIIHNALEDVNVQEKGFVFLAYLRNVKLLKNFDRNTHKMFWGSLNDWLPLKIRAVHFIRPPPFADVLLPVIKFLMGRRLRQRMRFHNGTNVDVLRSLSSYGISESVYPIERELI